MNTSAARATSWLTFVDAPSRTHIAQYCMYSIFVINFLSLDFLSIRAHSLIVFYFAPSLRDLINLLIISLVLLSHIIAPSLRLSSCLRPVISAFPATAERLILHLSSIGRTRFLRNPLQTAPRSGIEERD